jgi:hypothetical protein
MKINNSLVVAASILVSGAAAFCPPQQHQARASTDLSAQNEKWGAATAAAVIGWTLATQFVGAADLPPAVASTSSIVAVLEKPAEPTYEKLDFTMPSYNAGSKIASGFGEGTEARLADTNSDATETDKQVVAMKKAEAARQERLKQQKEEAKAREADIKAREAVKKAERERRMKGIFD